MVSQLFVKTVRINGTLQNIAIIILQRWYNSVTSTLSYLCPECALGCKLNIIIITTCMHADINICNEYTAFNLSSNDLIYSNSYNYYCTLRQTYAQNCDVNMDKSAL